MFISTGSMPCRKQKNIMIKFMSSGVIRNIFLLRTAHDPYWQIGSFKEVLVESKSLIYSSKSYHMGVIRISNNATRKFG